MLACVATWRGLVHTEAVKRTTGTQSAPLSKAKSSTRSEVVMAALRAQRQQAHCRTLDCAMNCRSRACSGLFATAARATQGVTLSQAYDAGLHRGRMARGRPTVAPCIAALLPTQHARHLPATAPTQKVCPKPGHIPTLQPARVNIQYTNARSYSLLLSCFPPGPEPHRNTAPRAALCFPVPTRAGPRHRTPTMAHRSRQRARPHRNY